MAAIAPAAIATMRQAMDADQIATLDRAGAALAASTTALSTVVRGAAPDAEVLLLTYLPTVLDAAMPEAKRMNMPAGWAAPAFDVLQLEDYDWVNHALVALAREAGKLADPVIRQEVAQAVAYRALNRLNTARAKAELAQGTSASIMSLGKLAMSRILHEDARVRALLLGPEGLLEGADHPRAEDANFLALNAYFTSIGGGTDQIQRNIIGERVLGLPREPEIDRTVPFREVRAG